MEVIIYTWSTCPFCQKAKALLDKKNIPYTEHCIDDQPDKKKELYEQTGQNTVPYVFINGKLIGGYSELKELDDKEKI